MKAVLISTNFRGRPINGRGVFLALCLLLPLSAVVIHAPTESRTLIDAPPGQSLAVKKLKKTKAPISVFADQDPTQSRPIVYAHDQFIAAEILDEKANDGVGNDRARSQSHFNVVAYDQSIATEGLDEIAPGGGLAAAIDAGKLTGLLDIVHGMHVHKTETDLINDGADPTAQVSDDSRSVMSRAQLATIPTKRSLQHMKVTCALIATYNSNESVDRVCKLRGRLLELSNFYDGEVDVSATDVAVCIASRNRPCPPRARQNRRLDMLASPFDTKRSLQNDSTPPPTSTPAYGYIVFTTIGLELTCEQIATRLRSTSGVLSVDVDVGGTTELGSVSDIALYFLILIRISRHLTPTPTQTTESTVILNEIFVFLLDQLFSSLLCLT